MRKGGRIDSRVDRKIYNLEKPCIIIINEKATGRLL